MAHFPAGNSEYRQSKIWYIWDLAVVAEVSLPLFCISFTIYPDIFCVIRAFSDTSWFSYLPWKLCLHHHRICYRNCGTMKTPLPHCRFKNNEQTDCEKTRFLNLVQTVELKRKHWMKKWKKLTKWIDVSSGFFKRFIQEECQCTSLSHFFLHFWFAKQKTKLSLLYIRELVWSWRLKWYF